MIGVTIAALIYDNGLRSSHLSGAHRKVSHCHNTIVSRGHISSGINISNGQCLSVSSLSSNQWHCCQATAIMCRGFESHHFATRHIHSLCFLALWIILLEYFSYNFFKNEAEALYHCIVTCRMENCE